MRSLPKLSELVPWSHSGGFFVLLLDVARLNFRVNPYLHGSARWADLSDIKAAGLLNNDGVYVGAWRDKRGKIHYLRHAGPEHVLCYAPTRSGKGVGLIVPTLLSWKQSVFVTDLKGELYELTAGWRHEHAHNRILRFEPAAAAGSCCFNPMEELRIGTEHEVGDAQNLALLIVDPDGKGLRADNHWQKTAYSLLVGCILHLCYKGKVEGTPATFAALDQMLADSSRPIQDLWNEMLTYATSTAEIIPLFPPLRGTCSTGLRSKPGRCYRPPRLSQTFTGIRLLPRTPAVRIFGSGT